MRQHHWALNGNSTSCDPICSSQMFGFYSNPLFSWWHVLSHVGSLQQKEHRVQDGPIILACGHALLGLSEPRAVPLCLHSFGRRNLSLKLWPAPDMQQGFTLALASIYAPDRQRLVLAARGSLCHQEAKENDVSLGGRDSSLSPEHI